MPIYIPQLVELLESGDTPPFLNKEIATVIIHPNNREAHKKIGRVSLKLFGRDYEPYLKRLSGYLTADESPHIFLLGEHLFNLPNYTIKAPVTNKLYDKTFKKWPGLKPKERDITVITDPSASTIFSWKVENYQLFPEIIKNTGITKLDVTGEFDHYTDTKKKKKIGCVNGFINKYKELFEINKLKGLTYP